LVLIGCFIIPFLFLLPACKQKLDKDGGFYDEKTRTYKYVKPKGRGSAQQVYAPISAKLFIANISSESNLITVLYAF